MIERVEFLMIERVRYDNSISKVTNHAMIFDIEGHEQARMSESISRPEFHAFDIPGRVEHKTVRVDTGTAC